MRKLTKAIIAVLCIVLCMSIFFACDPADEPATHEHNYSELKSSATKHWYECPDDGEIKPDSEQAHYDENRDGKCDLCGHNVTVVDIKGVRFAIAGKDGKTDVSLNGVEVTISYKTNSFKATIADGQFVSTEIIPIGEYTVSAEGYNSTTINITKDGIDAAVVILNKTHIVENSVKIEEVEGVPTLIVEGMIPEIENVTIGNVMLHYDAQYTAEGADAKETHHVYVANTSEYAGVYHFELPLNTLPINNDTPWCWFHIYPYAEENPTKDSTPLVTGSETDLARGDILQVGDTLDYDGVEYSVHAQDEGTENEGTQLVLQAKKIPSTEITVKDIQFDKTNGFELVVKGTYVGKPGLIALHANDGSGNHYYGANISKTAGEIELRFDLTQLPVESNPWYWFHIYIYDDANPTDPSKYDSDVNLMRTGFFEVGDYDDYNGYRYSIKDQYNMVCISPSAIPTINNITSVEIKQVEEKPVLVVKGTTGKDVPCLKIHVNKGSDNFYGEGVSTIAGQEFELSFDMSQLNATGTYWFHIWDYADAEPEDNSAKAGEFNLPISDFEDVQKGKTFDYEDLRYTFKADYASVQLEITNVPKTVATSIEFETIEGVPTLVIKGTVADGVPAIKLHAWHEEALYWDNLSTEAGKMEFHVPVTALTHVGNVCYFHTMTYDATATENQYGPEVNVERGDLIAAGTYVEHNGIRYWVKADEGLQVVPVSIESVAQLDITSVTIDTTDGLTLVVKGSTNQQIPCLKIHADGGGENWYGTGASVLTEGGGEFELTFDLTQLKTDGKPWCWFHIYAYTDVEPADNASKASSVDLKGDNWYIRGGESVTYNGVKYTAVSGNGTYGVFIIQPSVVTAE